MSPSDTRGETTAQGIAINTKHVQTQVLVENGGTVVIGGIFELTENEDESRVPLLGDIPVLGNLFKTRNRTSNKQELLVFITPKMIDRRCRALMANTADLDNQAQTFIHSFQDPMMRPLTFWLALLATFFISACGGGGGSSGTAAGGTAGPTISLAITDASGNVLSVQRHQRWCNLLCPRIGSQRQ